MSAEGPQTSQPPALRDALVGRILHAASVAVASSALVIVVALAAVVAQSCDANRTTRAAIARLGR